MAWVKMSLFSAPSEKSSWHGSTTPTSTFLRLRCRELLQESNTIRTQKPFPRTRERPVVQPCLLRKKKPSVVVTVLRARRVAASPRWTQVAQSTGEDSLGFSLTRRRDLNFAHVQCARKCENVDARRSKQSAWEYASDSMLEHDQPITTEG